MTTITDIKCPKCGCFLHYMEAGQPSYRSYMEWYQCISCGFNPDKKEDKENIEDENIIYYETDEYGEICKREISTLDPYHVRHDDKVVIIKDFYGEITYNRNFEDEKNALIKTLQERIEKIKTLTEENFNE